MILLQQSQRPSPLVAAEAALQMRTRRWQQPSPLPWPKPRRLKQPLRRLLPPLPVTRSTLPLQRLVALVLPMPLLRLQRLRVQRLQQLPLSPSPSLLSHMERAWTLRVAWLSQ